jgi:1,4-dihydroxy-2-naphthoate polyprenyltransferase
VQLTDHDFTRPNQPTARKDRPQAPLRSFYRRVLKGPPKGLPELVAVLLRLDSTPAFIMPPLAGVALGWWQTGQLSVGLLIFLVLGTLTAVWGSAILSEYFDYRRSLHVNSQAIDEPFFTGLNLIQKGKLQPRVARDLGLILFVLSAVCALWLGMLGGWAVLFFAALALVMAAGAAVAPLLKAAYWAWALIEVIRWVAFGFLPVLTGYYMQAPALILLPLTVGVGFAFFVATVLFAQRIIHQRRDWLLHKRTLSVQLGPARSIDVCVLLTVAGYVALLMGASLTALPLWTLISLFSLPLALRTFAHMRRDDLTIGDSVLLYEAAISATAFTGFLFVVALMIDRLG